MPAYNWNGIGLTAPDGWEPAALERDGFLLEKDALPLCELKWNVIHGTFSFAKHLKRLTKRHKGVTMHAVPEQEVPAPWGESVTTLGKSGIRVQSFIWRTRLHKGLGAALHNPATGLAALIQFFIHDEAAETEAARVLATFRDYSGGRTVPWAMFGIAARVPADFRLDTFSFKPGHYTVKFWRAKSRKQGDKLPAGKGPGTALVFERFAPASVLLKGTTLASWAGESMESAPPDTIPMVSGQNDVTWAGIAKTSLLRKALRRERHVMGRVWTTEGGNAILGVSTSGSLAMQGQSFTDICESYALV